MKVLLVLCFAALAWGKPQLSSVHKISFPLNHIPIANGPLPEKKIIGGSDATPGQYPWQISLQRTTAAGERYHSCGGTLVDPTHVVCAAHCVHGVTDADLKGLSVVVGAHNVNDPTESTQQRRNVSKYIEHESFSMTTVANDVSVIVLDSPVELNERVQVLPIAEYQSDNNVEPSGTCTLTGWGNSNPTGGTPVIIPEALQTVPLEIIPHGECALDFLLIAIVRKTMVCANDRDGGKGACNGDSGGPLICPDENGNPYLAGIVSFGVQPCGSARFPSVFTKVSSFAQWIADAIAKN